MAAALAQQAGYHMVEDGDRAHRKKGDDGHERHMHDDDGGHLDDDDQ